MARPASIRMAGGVRTYGSSKRPLRIAPTTQAQVNAYTTVETRSCRESPLQVAIVGHTGVGKSTLVNILAGQNIAEVSNDATPCTGRAESHEITRDLRCCIWDTRGMNEGELLLDRMMRHVGVLPSAEREMKRFLRGRNPSLDLVLLCIDATKIKVKVHWKIYNKVYVDFCERKVKVAVVLMRLNERDIRGSQWKRTCQVAAAGIVTGEDFPEAEWIEAVPKFGRLGEPSVQDCRGRILQLISRVRNPGAGNRRGGHH